MTPQEIKKASDKMYFALTDKLDDLFEDWTQDWDRDGVSEEDRNKLLRSVDLDDQYRDWLDATE